MSDKIQQELDQLAKKYSHVPVKGGWEVPRKLFHYSIETQDVYPILMLFLCIVGSAEFLRFNFEWFNQLYCYLLGPLMRPTEIKNRINGVVYYLWTDPTASICGKLWGKYTLQYGGKSLAGSLGAMITGALVTLMYFGPLARYPLSYTPATSEIPLIAIALYGGLVAAFSEGVSNLMFGLDDNLTIPVISAILLWIPLVGFGLGN
ncbi:phosphatidate cytidylyltransferase [Parasitella parasitica]|nr:phosphatidate cytidylyltransferase [Parasitella parasitica]